MVEVPLQSSGHSGGEEMSLSAEDYVALTVSSMYCGEGNSYAGIVKALSSFGKARDGRLRGTGQATMNVGWTQELMSAPVQEMTWSVSPIEESSSHVASAWQVLVRWPS